VGLDPLDVADRRADLLLRKNRDLFLESIWGDADVLPDHVTIGSEISGKISFGMRRMDTTPINTINIAMTTKV
jgi:hypothetical protein